MTHFQNVEAGKLEAGDIIRILITDRTSVGAPTYTFEIVEVIEPMPMLIGRTEYVEVAFMSHAGRMQRLYNARFPIQTAFSRRS